MPVIFEPDLASYPPVRDLNLPAADLAYLASLANGLIDDILGDLARTPTRARTIALEVVARAGRNPGGYASETVDDYTYRRDAETRQAGVYLTPSETAELRGMLGSAATGYSIGVTSPWDTV